MKTYEILIWAGLGGLTVSAYLLAGWWLCVLVPSLGALLLGVALSREPEPEPYETPEGLDSLVTASPEPDA